MYNSAWGFLTTRYFLLLGREVKSTSLGGFNKNMWEGGVKPPNPRQFLHCYVYIYVHTYIFKFNSMFISDNSISIGKLNLL